MLISCLHCEELTEVEEHECMKLDAAGFTMLLTWNFFYIFMENWRPIQISLGTDLELECA